MGAFRKNTQFEHLAGVSLYIVHLVKSAGSLSAIDAAFYGLKWFHGCLDLVSPTESSIVKNALESAKRALSKKRVPMEPVNSEALMKLCADFADSSDLTKIRGIVMSVLAYAGFLRVDELRNLKVVDLLLHEKFVTIVIKQGKTDQFRQGDHVDIVRTGSVACPVGWVQKYLKLAQLDPDNPAHGGLYVFRQISASKKCAKKLVSVNRPLSYSAVKRKYCANN